MKRQQSKRNKDQFVNLPREILIDILSTLPTRTIINCKAVCRAWRDVIECVEFTRFRLTKPDPNPYLITYTYPTHRIFELKGRNPLLLKVVEFSLLPRYVGMRGTVNGLILLGKQLNHLYVCNPITREFVKLPNHHSRFNYNSYGFGVSRTSGQYKVVRIFQHLVGSCTRSECQVYTLGTKVWRTIAVGAPPRPRHPTPPLRPPTLKSSINKWNAKCELAGGNLYWLDDRTQTEVCCFDLEIETFASFVTPPTPIGHLSYQRSLSILDDRLSLCDAVDDGGRTVEVEIWSMRGGGDWSKEYLIRDVCGRNLYAFPIKVFPIKVLEDGGMLVGERNCIGRYAKRAGKEASGYSILYPECCCQHFFDNVSVCSLSFLSLKTLFAREDVQRFVHTKPCL